MVKTHDELVQAGFACFPTTPHPPTYSSALVSSTIDFFFHRNATLSDPEVARVYIALHRPLAASITLKTDTPSTEAKLEPAFGQSSLLYPH
jgi:hypothetical protein